MRTVAEMLQGRDMTVEEYLILNRFWIRIREVQRERDPNMTKNRDLVGVALGYRRIHQQEVDIETLASLTGLGRSSLQKTLKAMERDKMIELYKDDADKRRLLVRPTRKYTDRSLDMYEKTRILIEEVERELKALRAKK
ncbi:hypothetical protein [Sneathiella sp.]|uniref:hypothetical protein n=1 Tax=Sneathiella sp. TaxID=1964365 RepID=UPI002FE2141B